MDASMSKEVPKNMQVKYGPEYVFINIKNIAELKNIPSKYTHYVMVCLKITTPKICWFYIKHR